jgi:putative membrane protein
MSETLDRPQPPLLLDATPDAEARIDLGWQPPVLRQKPQGGSLRWVAAGVAVLFGVWVASDLANLVAYELSADPLLGGLTLAGIVFALACLATGIAMEWRSLRRMRSVEQLRLLLATDTPTDPALARAACLDWLAALPGTWTEASRAVAQAATLAELRATLRAQVLVSLRDRARDAGWRAAFEGGALVAVVPTESLDGAAAAWRAWLRIRQIARLYGLRPGPAVLATLLRRIAWMAASVAGTELLAQSATDHALSSLPIFRHFAKASGVGVTAYRLFRLATVAAEACSPLPERGPG